MTSPDGGHVYFHSPCFDGIASAVVASDFLERYAGWRQFYLHQVNYELRNSWLRSALRRPAAVVDFLYHPDVTLWADHHQTAFLDESVRRHFEERRTSSLIYNDRADSCARLLWIQLSNRFNYQATQFDELTSWADRIDAAKYGDVQEAMFSKAPAVSIARGLAVDAAPEYSERLVRALRLEPLSAVSEYADVRSRADRARLLSDAGLDRFERNCWIDDGIAMFDVDAHEVIVNRYAPYLFHPDALYSLGILRFPDAAKISSMRNPWREFPSVPLGVIAARFGGGGHHRVASITLRGPQMQEAKALLQQFRLEIVRDRAHLPAHPQ
jgi:hypothetical protein